MSSFTISCLMLLGLVVGNVAAFGAGNIPSYGALEGLAFRHGDIEDILLQLAMVPTSAGASGFLSSLNPLSSAGKKFNAMAVKRVYFGNWLRDYSQALDVGTLSKGLDQKTIQLLVWVMGFMAFGYATEEFEVTSARLGVYRPEEHIDNPKGYPNPEEPDARKFDARLRGPVESVEIEIDMQSGMKNYIANERGGWMTSSSYVRNSLLRCIELGREYNSQRNDVLKYESLRVLGQALHTLEDFSAHSNFCELVLNELGYGEVFAQVGKATSINLNGRNCFPLTTGTFGGLDFVHSLLGEASDKISQTQISEVANGLSASSTQGSSSLLNSLQGMVNNVPGFALPRDLNDMQELSREADDLRNADSSRASFGTAIDIDADEIARKIYPIMAFRDRIVKGLSAFFEKIPGLSALIDEISETLTVWVLATIEPFMKPVVQKVTAGLGAGQSLVTSKDDQLAVFEDPHCSDPTHSMLAKDHFSCYLNRPAGLIGQAVVRHTVVRITAAWHDPSVQPHAIIDEILEVFHHPANARGRTSIQGEMKSIVEHWVNSLGAKKSQILQGLSFDGVKQGRHHEGGSSSTTGVLASHGHSHSNTTIQQGIGRQTQVPGSRLNGGQFGHASRPDHVVTPGYLEPQSNQGSGASASYYNGNEQGLDSGAYTPYHNSTASYSDYSNSAAFPVPAYSSHADYGARNDYYGQQPDDNRPGFMNRPLHTNDPYRSHAQDNMQPQPPARVQPQTYGESSDWTRPQSNGNESSRNYARGDQSLDRYDQNQDYSNNHSQSYGRDYS